ncbi:MAG: translocation/assembly module TamB domain-containing protein, partial [Alphaproteobacteria bacterium]|nr:translocation/assembly module TamB domain-containing protein [Alphaproteobacteria bacterium]
TGTPAAPITKGDITIGNLDTGAYKDLRFTAQLNHENGTATTQINGAGPGLRTFTINAALPLDFSAQPFTFALNDAVALSGAINADIDVAAITPLFLPPTQEATGTLATKATLGGTFKSPAIDGTLSFNDGLFIDRANGVHLADLSASGTFDKDRLTIQKFTGTDGADGRLNGNGTMDFGDNQGTNLKLTLNEFHLPQSEMANGTLNADLTLKDSNDGYNLAGDITVARMDIMIPERFQSNIPTLNIIDPAQQAQEQNNPQKIFDLAITVDAPNQVFVRGWGLDAEFGGKVDISGDAAAPIFDGTLKSRRGRYEEFGKRFTLSRAELRFQGRIPPSPYLDIEATTPADDVTASILLTGPVNDPAISFAAVPALPQDEVLSRILFGRNTSRITPMQAIQLTQTMRRFSGQGGGGFDPLGTLRNVTGLDNIAVDTDESGATNVGVGKYLSDKVYLEFNRGQGEASGAANLQIEVSPQISVETEVGQDARAGGGVFWRRDY